MLIAMKMGQKSAALLLRSFVYAKLRRWKLWSAAAAFLFAAVIQQTLLTIAYFTSAPMAVLAVWPLQRKWGWESLHGNILRDFLFGILAVLAMHAGRAAAALVTGTPPEALPLYITTDVITYLFTALIIWTASRLDGVLEDQPHYVQRIAAEEKH